MRQMKDSGIEWIGEIPAEWEVRRLSTLISLESGCPISSDDILNEGLYPIYGGNGIRGYTNSYYIDGNFILIGRQGAQCGNIHYTLGKIWATEHALIVKSITDINKKFLYFLLISMNLNQYSTTAAQPGLSAANIRKKYICYPCLNEQQRIADYLDAQCARIDETMELVRQSKEKLRAYKLSLITEAVTKGLDPDVPMKDSGIPWIGEIPAEWEIGKLKKYASTLTPMRDKPEFLDGDIPWIRIEDFSGKYIEKSKEGLGVSRETVKSMNLKIYPIGTILCTSSCDLGKCAITSVELVSNQRFIGIIPNKNCHPDFLYYIIRSSAERLNFLSTGSIQANLSRAAFEHLQLQFPPLPEQQRIAAYLDEKCARIDALLAEKDELLDKLAEYKKSLIFECVTGKREVAA